MVCNYRGETIRFTITANSHFCVSLMLFILTLPLVFDFIHSIPPSDIYNLLRPYHCSNDSITNGSDQQRNLNVVINSVLDNVNKTGFSRSIHGQNRDEIYGDAQCRGDLNASACGGCVSKAIEHLRVCTGSLSYASIYLSGCMFRYATHNFYSKLNVSDASHAIFTLCNNIKINGTEARGVTEWKIASVLERLIEKAGSSKLGYSTLNDYGVYSLAECSRTSNMSECSRCLNNMYNYFGYCPAGTSQGFAFFDHCIICYDSHKFYGDGVPLLSSLKGSESTSGPSIPPSRPTQGNIVIHIYITFAD